MAPGVVSSQEQVIHSSGNTNGCPDLRFLHFNDVYHVDSSSAEPVGGFARFQTLRNYYHSDKKFQGQPELLTFFSGDAFNPSLESSVTKGSHMVPVLNNIGTDVACVGNHDLDFGVRQFRNLTAQCDFPWLLANVLDPALGENEPLGNAKKTVMLTSSNGIKVGVIGLAEREWLDTINSLPPDIIYKSASQTAKELVPGLREQGAQIIIAVTHQREPNDNKLAEKVPKGLIDIILGGHDHYYNHSFINGVHVLRSGTDFKQLSYIEARRRPNVPDEWDFDIIRRDITSDVVPDPASVTLVERQTASLKTKLEKPIGYTAAPLDARFRTVRLKESNIGNFVCDLMRHTYQADCGLMAAGTIRGDQIYPPGVLRLKDIMNCFPFEDPVVVINVTGQAILEALENSFHPEKPEGSRIISCEVAGGPLDKDRVYKLATRGYMARGKDGYDSLLIEAEGGKAVEIVSEENGVLISTLLRQYFMSLKVLGKWKMWGPSMGRHWQGVQRNLQAKHPHMEPQSPTDDVLGAFESFEAERTNRSQVTGETDGVDADSEDETATTKPISTQSSRQERELEVMRRVMRKWWRLAGMTEDAKLGQPLNHGEFTVNWTTAIAPMVEGRIKQFSPVKA
ncbi:5'-nucleotidase [Pseudovirgaria hyperparasitica]|uniref:5'-nucleotidase n=1 Tax=Pseudovirgaria hyperparasitica TaxID=470096 RepID=A0A6A6W4J6_9PEZI|nr:5'-nucleotidase [Pseudovirgaria hyperparasitica]KAF2757792.1 5'-nucleotidase [Pseudovirgaria hyperparasitica]